MITLCKDIVYIFAIIVQYCNLVLLRREGKESLLFPSISIKAIHCILSPDLVWLYVCTGKNGIKIALNEEISVLTFGRRFLLPATVQRQAR